MEIRQEEDRLPRRPLLLVAAAGLVVTAIGILTAWGITDCRSVDRPRAAYETGVGGELPEEVNAVEIELFADEGPARRQWRGESERLTRFGWVDREHGIVHIPIDRAIDLYLSRRADGASARPSTASREQEESP